MTLSIDTMDTVIYGDSFSNLEIVRDLCGRQTDRTDMWYHGFCTGDLIDRTTPRKTPGTMFLQATHDALTRKTPTRLIVALGVCERLPAYTDGWYGEEVINEDNNMDDCEPYFTETEVNRSNMAQLHPTLMWTQIYKEIVQLSLLCDTHRHQLMITHMNTDAVGQYINKRHPLIRPLCQLAESLPCYFNEQHSCKTVCQEAGVKPLDYAQYGWDGHHGPEGQRIFAEHMATLAKEAQLWN
tara:strand:- start:1725 stop:2444 length:720 start_codon:yes stop_codon:yes gene_type:complete